MKLWVCLVGGLVFCLGGSFAIGNEASVPVWRCGNLYTNNPQPGQSCESVTISTLEEPAGKPPAPRVDAVAQRERDDQAKAILNNELKRLSERCQAATDTQTVQRCAADQAALKRELSRLP
jgi:hypothetical protein